jgi:hypothetical protein
VSDAPHVHAWSVRADGIPGPPGVTMSLYECACGVTWLGVHLPAGEEGL